VAVVGLGPASGTTARSWHGFDGSASWLSIVPAGLDHDVRHGVQRAGLVARNDVGYEAASADNQWSDGAVVDATPTRV